MLKVLVCWNTHQIHSLLTEYREKGYTVDRQNRKVEKDGKRGMIVHQLDLRKLEGFNPDKVDFLCFPSYEEQDLAIARTAAKKGKVYIQGRKIYDWAKNTTKTT